MNINRKIVVISFTLMIFFLVTPLAANAVDNSLVFSDDFSTQKNWVDESNGNIYRDAINQWLVWNVTRSEKRRYYIPINAESDQIELNFRFNMTAAGGNGGTQFGLIENLYGTPTYYAEASGVWVSIARDTSYGPRVLVGAKYEDGSLDGHTTPEGVNYGSLNVWRQAKLTVGNGVAKVVVWDDFGNELGQVSITMSQSHTAYNYLMVFVDGTGGWEWGSGLFDDIEVWGKPLNNSPIAEANGPYLVAVEQSVELDGSGSTDPDGDFLINSWAVADPTLGMVADSTFTAGIETGITEITLTVDDGRGGTATDTATVVVYDPEGGFVTGGGWIDSPEGAYKADLTLTGKATFGFVSKYNKKTSLPEGNTQFVFNAGDLNFHSSDYDWLVVNKNDSRAQFKGTGTINGEGVYKFMLWASDGTPDTFRIKIWWEDGEIEHIIYDNGVDQALGGGSIVVHTKK